MTREAVPAGIKRIALEQINEALVQLTDSNGNLDEAVHDARTCCKKLRAVLRLVRNEIGKKIYKRENVLYRDAGRRLSALRDSAVKLETLDKLVERCGDPSILDAIACTREGLASEYRTAVQDTLDEQPMAKVTTALREARSHVGTWPIEHDDFSALCGGLRRVYKRGRRRLADARARSNDENLHEWRKQVKYLWYHIRILRPSWSDMLGELARSLHDLSNILGEDHDLAELRRVLPRWLHIGSEGSESHVLTSLIDQRRAELQSAAWPLGQRIYVEKPAAFVDRLAGYWQIWRQAVG
jgi:CHAD domain-containing protein